MTAPSNEPQFREVRVPSRIADLGFTALIPADFRPIELPAEKPDFEKPEYFLPLYAAMAPYGAVVFSVVARPAYDNGTVEDWARYHASRQVGTLHLLERGVVGGLQAVVCEASQSSEAGTMRMRIAFIEDGGRLLIVSGMAPEQVWSSLKDLLWLSISSFRLETPRGQSTPVMRLPEPPPYLPHPPHASTEPEQNDPAEPVAAPDRPTEAADVALAGDASSLDPEHPLNATMRNSGRGLVPRVLEVNEQARYAVLGAAATMSIFRVPFGWHVIDDARRTLVFDAAGKVQINLDIRTCGPDHGKYLDSLLQEHRKEQPDLSSHLRLGPAGMACLGLRNYRVGGQELEQAFLVKDIGLGERALVCRVTAEPEDFTRAMNVAEVVLQHLRHAGQMSAKASPTPSPQNSVGTAWAKAQELEQAGRFEDAEKTIIAAIDHLGAYSQVAYLYEQRLDRLLAAGDRQGTLHAFDRARHWLWTYASCATSGGEGEALSRERDERISAMRIKLGPWAPEE